MKKDNSANIKQEPACNNIDDLILYIEDYLIQLRLNPLKAVCSIEALDMLQPFQKLKNRKPEPVYRAASRAACILYDSANLQRPCSCDLKKLVIDIESLKIVCFIGTVK